MNHGFSTSLFSMFLFLTLGSQQILAATAICTGQITQISYHIPDGLNIKIGAASQVKACSFNVKQFRVTPESCRAMAAMAIAARTVGASVTLYVDNAPTTNCLDIPGSHVSDTRYLSY